jgi:CIC family chloride channel protein
VLCALLGAMVGAVTVALHFFTAFAHRLIFALKDGDHLSAAAHIDPRLLLAVPVAGGLLLALFNREMRRLRPGDIADPIEANAVYGGRMSVIDSLRLLAATLLSNMAGVSVGMEAAYTQIGACFMSWSSGFLQLRREDMRIFVAAGAAAAIAAAYNAPLAGAFYGFELVLGIYTTAALPQVTLCALSAALLPRFFASEADPVFSLHLDLGTIPAPYYFLFAALGAAAAAVGITTMKAVTACEHLFRRLLAREDLRLAIGGILVGLLAYVLSPQVLGSGQGAIDLHLHGSADLTAPVAWLLWPLALVLAGKIAASAISLGAGFRGGLFSASLFLGCLAGQLAGLAAAAAMPQLMTPGLLEIFMLVGTGSVAASIVGAPMTMVLLVLEMTGSFQATSAVLAGVLVSSTVTRYAFGYSFATWRFHLRGIGISGPRDVGWVNEVTVEQLMLRGPRIERADTPLAELRQAVPVGSLRSVFLVDDKEHYQGTLSVADMHSPDLDAVIQGMTAFDLARGKDRFLLPRQNIQEALRVFSEARLEELPVLASSRSHKIIGYAREVQALKRYSQEVEAVHNAA